MLSAPLSVPGRHKPVLLTLCLCSVGSKTKPTSKPTSVNCRFDHLHGSRYDLIALNPGLLTRAQFIQLKNDINIGTILAVIAIGSEYLICLLHFTAIIKLQNTGA